jgi:tetratricopeptide (TPR) repeat protein
VSTIAESLAQGLELHKRGELARAEPIYRAILAREPDHAEALHLLGLVALQTSRIAEALPLLEQAVARKPQDAERLGNLAVAYRLSGRPQDAVSTLDEAIRLKPCSAGAYYNRGLALYDLGRLDDVAADYRRTLELTGGNHASALNNLGDLERELGQFDAALAHLDAALALDPRDATAHYNRSLVLLSVGRLAEGFAENEWRLRLAAFRPREFSQPRWDGGPLRQETLLVYAEQGLGDVMQFVRYLPLVARRAERVHVEVPPAVVPLLNAAGFRGLVAQGSPLPHFDAHVSLASLPAVFGTTLESIPAAVPYLAADGPRVERWRGELARYDGLKAGIVWQGNPTFREDRFRSIPLAALAPLAAVPGVRLFSLQKGPGSEQLSQFAAAFRIVDLGSRHDNESATFADTAAIMRNLDLVVTSDTACAHLAGALNVPVWLALSRSPSWRWLQHRADSPWYPSARLFRQASFGDWASVFRSMAGALGERVGAV